MASIADHLGVDTASVPELAELERDVTPEQLLDEIESQEETDDTSG